MNIHDLLPAVVIIVVTILVAAFSGNILQSVQTSQYKSTITTNESIDFADNNTYYSAVGNPITSITAIYDDAAHTNTYLPEQYTYSTTQIKVYTNGTLDFPNMTTGVKYVDYVWTNQYTTRPISLVLV